MDQWLSFWYEALASQLGIIISTSDTEAARQRLYKARREAEDADLAKMSVRISPSHPKDEIWIVKDDPKS